jgi:uncharacterized repeat protein (TIGR03943 family)
MSIQRRNMLILSEIGLLVGLAAVLLARWQRDQLSFYIHPRYAWLVVSAAVVLALLALVRLPQLLRQSDEPVSGGPLLMLAVPLLLATLVPPQPLNGATLLARGDQLNRIAATDRRDLSEDTRSWDLLAWGYALSLDAEQLAGSPADVVGFTVPDESNLPDTALLARYVVTCCAADGSAVGLLLAAPGVDTLPADSWVRAVGTIELREIDGIRQPVLVAAELTPIEQPAVPYLFP